MITVKNVSNKDCIQSLKDFIHNNTRITIYLISENDSGITDFDPVELKNILPGVESLLTSDFHGIIEYIQHGLDNNWFRELLEPPKIKVFKFYILMEYLQMKRYRNPGVDPSHQTVIVYHLKEETSHDIHCQIIGSSPFYPSHTDFLKSYKSIVNTFFDYHQGFPS